jgi:hypothetical protein
MSFFDRIYRTNRTNRINKIFAEQKFKFYSFAQTTVHFGYSFNVGQNGVHRGFGTSGALHLEI